jgi:hypothetical protein
MLEHYSRTLLYVIVSGMVPALAEAACLSVLVYNPVRREMFLLVHPFVLSRIHGGVCGLGSGMTYMDYSRLRTCIPAHSKLCKSKSPTQT